MNRHGPTLRLFALLFLFITGAGLAPAVLAQDALQEARTAFRNGEIDQAIDLLVDLTQDPGIDKQTQADVYTVLGRAYVAKRNTDEAKEAMAKLLKLEPPLIELDPVRETPQLMRAYYEARYELCGSYTVDPRCGSDEGPQVKTLAVADFTNAATSDHETYDPMRQGVASLLVGQLNAGIDLKVVERERIQWLLDELELQRDATVVDQSTAVRVGRLMGATHVIFGTFYVQKRFLSRKMVLQARIVDVETGEILRSENVSGKPKNVYGLAEDLGLKMAQAINVTLASVEEDPVRRFTKSLDAMMAYSRGEAFMERGAYQEAREKFLEALSYDPQFTLARIKADTVEPMLLASAN